MSEYARRRGCTEGAVRRAVRDGRIALIDGQVDPVAADAQWARNTRVRATSAAVAPAPPAAESTATPDWRASRAKREAIEADLAALRLAEQSGELVRLSAVRAALAARAVAFREGLLQLADRLAPVLAVETDQQRVHILLSEEIRGALIHLTDAL